MTVRKFATDVEHLLLTGSIEGDDLLKLYHLLKAYEKGTIVADVLRTAIDQHDPDQIQQWFEGNLPPLFD